MGAHQVVGAGGASHIRGISAFLQRGSAAAAYGGTNFAWRLEEYMENAPGTGWAGARVGVSGRNIPLVGVAEWPIRDIVLFVERMWPRRRGCARNIPIAGVVPQRIQGGVMFVVRMTIRMGGWARNIPLAVFVSWRNQDRVMFAVWMRKLVGDCARNIPVVCFSPAHPVRSSVS